MVRRKYQPVSQSELADLDKALEIVGGRSFATAKLLDMTPERARGLINHHKALRERWGRPWRGRPRVLSISLAITPFHDRVAESAWLGGSHQAPVPASPEGVERLVGELRSNCGSHKRDAVKG